MKTLLKMGVTAFRNGTTALFAVLLAGVVVAFVTLFAEAERYAADMQQTPVFHIVKTVAAFTAGAFLCRALAPLAAGSGVLLVGSSAKLWRKGEKSGVEAALGFKTLCVKVLACLCCAAGGGALGREGPVVHISASIFYLISERLNRRFAWIKPDQWITAGAAAGFAAAFKSPMAAFVFAAEEFGEKVLTPWRTVAPLTICAAYLAATALTDGGRLIFAAGPGNLSVADFPVLAAVAFVTGTMAAALRKAEKAIRAKALEGKFPFLLFSAGCGLATGMAGVYAGPGSFGGGLEHLQSALAAGAAPLSPVETAFRFFNTVVTLAAGNAGGTLAPALAMGGGTGGTFASLFAPEAMVPLTAAGMAGFLGALLDVPFAAAVLVAETTGRTDLFIYLMFTSLTASAFSREMATPHGQ